MLLLALLRNRRVASGPRASSGPALKPSARHVVVALLLAGTLVLAIVLHRHEPLEHWFFFRYARAIALAAVFSLSCLVAGHALLVRVLERTLPLAEHLAVALPLGVLAFFLASFAFGILNLYGWTFFVGGPALLLALGWPSFRRTAARIVRHASGRQASFRFHPLGTPCLIAGCLGVLYLWFTILTPQNASFDSRWYHQPIAEIYVAQGGIAPFSEGWVPGAFPQLASLLYAWAFSMPGSTFDRVITAAHLELAVFLMTLVGISAIVRRVLGERSPLAWVALFLFPGILCYDSGLVLGADHVVAVFAPAIFLCCTRYLETPSRAQAVLLGACVAGALNTKYTAVILAVLPAVVVAIAAVRDVRSGRLRLVWSHAGLFAVTALLLTAPHWLKNAVYYADPLFPVLRRWLPAHPWHEGAEAPHPIRFGLHSPPFSARSLREMVKTLVTFSFVPHDFPQFHRDVPVFGSLFTLTTPIVPFLGRRRRLWLLVLGVYLGMVTWFWIHQFDRYLQALVPWMAASTAVVLTLVWRLGVVPRVASALLVGVQAVWALAVPFIPSHRATGAPIAKLVIDLLGRNYRGEHEKELAAYPDWEAVGRALPRGAKLLVHEEQNRAGLSVVSAIDYSGDQGAFYYGETGASSPAEIHRLLRNHDISHVLWVKNIDHGSDTVAAGLVFHDFVTHHTDVLGTFGGYALSALRTSPPPDTPPGLVAYYPCEKPRPYSPPEWNPVWSARGLGWPLFAHGLYRLGDMARWPGDERAIPPPAAGVTMEQAFVRARFIVYDARCHGPFDAETRARFELFAARGHAMMFVRRGEP